MKMTVKYLMDLVEDTKQDLENLTKLCNACEWDAKDKIDNTAEVNMPFNMICKSTMGKLDILLELLRESMEYQEVDVCGKM